VGERVVALGISSQSVPKHVAEGAMTVRKGACSQYRPQDLAKQWIMASLAYVSEATAEEAQEVDTVSRDSDCACQRQRAAVP
jgi:hypothetical protein